MSLDTRRRIATTSAPNTPHAPTGVARGWRLPPGRIATHPIEERGGRRDDLAMLVSRPHLDVHARLRHLPHHLGPGDVLVVNDSPTMPAALDVGAGRRLHVAGPAPGTDATDGLWVVEPRTATPTGTTPGRARPGAHARVAGHELRLLGPADGAPAGTARLWQARVTDPDGHPVDETGMRALLWAHGGPVVYANSGQARGIGAFQTLFANTGEPGFGSAEMPSAGRGFTRGLLRRLRGRGVTVAPITLHTGLSSPEHHERPMPERAHVGADTADLVNAARRRGGRVIAVGTTVVRALESAVVTTSPGRREVRPFTGWTDLVVTPATGVQVIDGLLSGFHEPEASHLDLLGAVLGTTALARAYCIAVAGPYLWHAFGDVHLLLRD